MRHHIMSFSGGFDSTLLLLYFLEEVSAHSKKNKNKELKYNTPFMLKINDFDTTENKIILVSVTHDSIGNVKNLKEYHAREKIINLCKKKYPDVKIDHIKINISLNTTSTLNGNTGLAQPMIWLSSIMPFMHEDDILYFGHIKNDAEVLIHDSINKIISGFTELQYPYISTSNHKIKVSCPLMTLSKEDVLFNLYNIDKDIFESCVTCESFKNESTVCGICHTCMNLKSALLSLMMDDNLEKSKFGLTYFSEWFAKSEHQKNILNAMLEI